MTCNSCNPCETGCKECCNPNIQGEGCVKVSTSEEGVIKIEAPCPTEVTSDDNTIKVEKKEPHSGYSERFDLSVNVPDKKVGACDSDTNPGSLYDKLDEGHGIDIDLVNCPGNGSVKISVDESELNLPNDKVAVSGGCSSNAGYLKDVLKSESKSVEFVEDGNCHYILRDKGGYQSGRMVLTESVSKGMEWNREAKYILGDFPGTASGKELGSYITIHAAFKTDDEVTHGMDVVQGGLRANQDGLYLVSYNANYECTFGIHGMRVLLIKVHPVENGGSTEFSFTELIESRYSGPVGKTPNEMHLAEAGSDYAMNYNGMVIADQTESEGGVTGLSASLGGVLDRMPNGGTTLVRMQKNDLLMLGVKGQSSVRYEGEYITWLERGGRFTVLGEQGNLNGGTDLGASVSAFMLVAL